MGVVQAAPGGQRGSIGQTAGARIFRYRGRPSLFAPEAVNVQAQGLVHVNRVVLDHVRDAFSFSQVCWSAMPAKTWHRGSIGNR